MSEHDLIFWTLVATVIGVVVAFGVVSAVTTFNIYDIA